ncbi:MAG: MarR family transcriptional regulator [Propionibacteriaceae bacterium]|jgi:DNA-binding MarR family transcriptional regulator|nr:MarR family transcriptional regulator [Propionibacteriaceae bacterium]
MGDLFSKMAQVIHLYRRQHMRGRGGKALDQTRGQGRILAMLKIQDAISTKDLSYLLGIRVTSLNELLAKLERSGYVTREPSPADRRVILIKLTPAGRDAGDPQGRQSDDVLAVLTPQEQAGLDACLDKLLESLQAGMTDELAQREEWAQQVRERMGDERFAKWVNAVGEELGDPRMQAMEFICPDPELGRRRRPGKRDRAKYEALMAALGEFPAER